MRPVINVAYFSDPGCPWAYSANPALAVLRWRYGAQLDWRLVMVGVTERAEQHEARGSSPATVARRYRRFGRYGMPIATEPRPRLPVTGRACRAVIAARLLAGEREWAVHRALQFAWFTSAMMLDEDDQIDIVLREVSGIDAQAVVTAIDAPDVVRAYDSDKAEARTAAGSPTALQGKAAATDGPVRYTAPSLVLSRGQSRLEAGGFQPVEALDVLIANLDPTLQRQPPPTTPAPVLRRFPDALATQEIAAVMTAGNDAPDRQATEAALIDLAASGRVKRIPIGDDAVWQPLVSDSAPDRSR